MGTWGGLISKVKIDEIKEKCNIYLGGGKGSAGKKSQIEMDEKFFENQRNLTDRSKSPIPSSFTKKLVESPINSDSATDDLFTTLKMPIFVKEIPEKDHV